MAPPIYPRVTKPSSADMTRIMKLARDGVRCVSERCATDDMGPPCSSRWSLDGLKGQRHDKSCAGHTRAGAPHDIVYATKVEAQSPLRPLLSGYVPPTTLSPGAS